MALVEPYSPCPCGSGQKFKWCCHKVESYAERAERLQDGGQVDAALKALDEGLRKAPDNPWLLIRKASIFMESKREDEALPLVARVVEKQPNNIFAQLILLNHVLGHEGPEAALARLHKALTEIAPAARAELWPAARVIGNHLAREGRVPAALAHIDLANALGSPDPRLKSTERIIRTSYRSSLWERNTYHLVDPPASLDGGRRAAFTRALEAAGQGLLAPASAAFEELAAPGDLPEALRNFALCRLWLADHVTAAEALARHIAQAGPTEEAIDLEALRQAIAPPAEFDQLDTMQLVWPVRDRAGLIDRLNNDRRVLRQPPDQEEEDPKGPPRETYLLLDRAAVSADAVRGEADIPRVLGELVVEADSVALQGDDDGGSLDVLSDRFTTIAGPTIPPAHPKTKRVGRVTRLERLVNESWVMPHEMNVQTVARFVTTEQRRSTIERWARTPLAALGGRTPERAARDGDAKVSLVAAWELFESLMRNSTLTDVDPSYRERIGIPKRAPLDPATLDAMRVHLGRLHEVPTESLSDEKLLIVYLRARLFDCNVALENTIREVLRRPTLVDTEQGVSRLALFADLSLLESRRGDRMMALAMIAQGREGDPEPTLATRRHRWDMLEVRVMARFDGPENWVPRLAIVIDRYAKDEVASSEVVAELVEMGLVQLIATEEGRIYFDQRPLQSLLERYGPRITTASGGLGVAENAAGIWTPGSDAAGQGRSGSGIWTPGQAPPPPPASAGTSKVIITGR